MATTDDFAGRNCPFCGAIDSLDVDVDRGEAACVECAKVVRMGLEESVFTRYHDGATFEDVDARAGDYAGSEDARLLAQASGSGGLSRSAAAALAAGLSLKHGGRAGAGAASADMNTEAGREAKYARAMLHSKMKNAIDHYTRISRRAAGVTDASGENPIKTRAISIARTYVGYRREHGKKVEHQSEVAAACFQIASELHEEPVPLAELRVMDPQLKNVESVRREIITDTRMEETEAKLRKAFAPNLLRFYLRLLHVQMSRFEAPTLLLLQAVERVASDAARNAELVQLVEAEKVFAAVLLARTENSITWDGKPPYDLGKEPPVSTAYASFAASARLNAARVDKVMQTMLRVLPDIRAAFATLLSEQQQREREKKEETASAEATTSPSERGAAATDVKKEALPAPLSGVKRERSPA